MAHNVSVCVLCVCTEIMHVKGESVRGSLRGPRLPPSLRWPSMTPSYHAFSPVQNTVTLVPSSNVSTLSLATCFFAGVLLRSRRAGMAHPFETDRCRGYFQRRCSFASRWCVLRPGGWRMCMCRVLPRELRRCRLRSGSDQGSSLSPPAAPSRFYQPVSWRTRPDFEGKPSLEVEPSEFVPFSSSLSSSDPSESLTISSPHSRAAKAELPQSRGLHPHRYRVRIEFG